MSIPLYIFLYFALAMALTAAIFALFSLYHMIRFGSLNFTTVFSSFIFIAGLTIITWFLYFLIKSNDWQQFISFTL